MEMFPTDEAARKWFEGIVWKNGRVCPHCGSTHTIENTSASENRPYRCQSCGQHFSVKKGTVMQGSPLPYRKWVLAIYLHMTSLKGVSSMKLQRDIGVTQKTAWFMLQRIREAFKRDDDEPPMSGPTEIDETYMGGRERNKHNSQKLKAGRGTVGKTAVVGAKDRTANEVRAQVVQSTAGDTLRKFATSHAQFGSVVYTDDERGYTGLASAFDHESVCHSAGEYVRDMARTNGIESFWAVLKRAHKGVYHKFSVKHLQRYVTDFAGRHNVRSLDTMSQM
ncbi:MAG: IS1595 family transposase [Aestuariivita sp.]|nr:IS1595 family transposase [Aestuariivita sp.]MCY4346743.1 IS1595 family transposase [Aestuariivita sp.]